MRRPGLPALSLVLVLGAHARADELVVVGRFSSSGRDARGPYAGYVVVGEDATYQDVRRGADGATRTGAGVVRVEDRGLVLTPGDGAPRRFARADDGRQVRWRWRQGDEEQVLVQAHPQEEGRLGAVRRLLGRPEGVTRWLLEGNLGVVEPTPGRLILRARQPTPADLVRYRQRYGLRTVVSLNGDLDERAWLLPDPAAGDGGRARQVNLKAFIAELGLRHEVFRLSADRAPSDDELRAIFRVLRDEGNKPLLIHCRGGSDRTGVVAALYAVEYQGQTKERAKEVMRTHLWAASGGTEIQGAVVDLYQTGHLRRLLGEPLGAWY